MTTKVNVLKTSVTLTSLQYAILSAMIEQVEKCMEWDGEMNCYTDGGNFIMSIPAAGMDALKELQIIFS